MRAYLVQHGEAHPEEVSPERELTPRGRSDVERVAALQRSHASPRASVG